MTNILQQLDLPLDDHDTSSTATTKLPWKLMPMIASNDLQASHLGDLLEHALERVRTFSNSSVVFLGMDAPALALEDIVYGLQHPMTAVLCPADDGGYGMLCVPPMAPTHEIFQGVQWSHSLTAVSQLKALTDQNVPIKIGKLMHDIDEPKDVERLCERLQQDNTSSSNNNNNLVLEQSCYSVGNNHGSITSKHPTCFHTRQALKESGLLSS